jgi:hypothetical protein
MAQQFFRMHTELTLETVKVKNRSRNLNENHKKLNKGIITGIDSMDKFIQEEKDILELIDLYSNLVDKDMTDIEKMVKETIAADQIKGITFCSK